MNIRYNKTFQGILSEYQLADDFSFKVCFPGEVEKVLSEKVIYNDKGITLESNGPLGELCEPWVNYSTMEDFINHFHVDSYIDPSDSKEIFMLGVKTLFALAEKLQKSNVTKVRCWYSFQTPGLSEAWHRDKGCYEQGEEYPLSDRLSFFLRRKGEDPVGFRRNEISFWARLVIDL